MGLCCGKERRDKHESVSSSNDPPDVPSFDEVLPDVPSLNEHSNVLSFNEVFPDVSLSLKETKKVI